VTIRALRPGTSPQREIDRAGWSCAARSAEKSKGILLRVASAKRDRGTFHLPTSGCRFCGIAPSTALWILRCLRLRWSAGPRRELSGIRHREGNGLERPKPAWIKTSGRIQDSDFKSLSDHNPLPSTTRFGIPNLPTTREDPNRRAIPQVTGNNQKMRCDKKLERGFKDVGHSGRTGAADLISPSPGTYGTTESKSRDTNRRFLSWKFGIYFG
jgi:hypothetical protein